MISLPGLVDAHTHMRDPGQTHKESWATGTAAALAGGFTTVLAMPNTDPPATDHAGFTAAAKAAAAGARCDFGLFAGATTTNVAKVSSLSGAVALKMYLDPTFGDLRLPTMDGWWDHMETWLARPIAVHAEGPALGAIVLIAELLDRSIHICHVSRRDEILLIRRAREKGIMITCEVAPHHLVLDEDDLTRLGGTAAVRPALGLPADRAALWEHLEVIDCFATDHAPHTLSEKTGPNPPPGFPGLETALPLLLGAVHDGKLEVADLVARLHTNPRRIFGLGDAPADTRVEVDLDATWRFDPARAHTRCDWSPFTGMELRGRVERVVLRGEEVFADGEVFAPPGTGCDEIGEA